MINRNAAIQFANVISKRYEMDYKDMEKTMEEFLTEIVSLNLTIKGPFFYSLDNIPIDGNVIVELFMPVVESKVNLKDKDKTFYRYYYIPNMVSHTLCENIKENTIYIYGMLLEFIEKNSLKASTPVFNIVRGDRNFQYLEIMIGTKPKYAKRKVR